MNKTGLEKQLSELKRKRNSLYAKEQVLKLRTSNKDVELIRKTQLDQDKLKYKITHLETLLLKYN